MWKDFRKIDSQNNPYTEEDTRGRKIEREQRRSYRGRLEEKKEKGRAKKLQRKT
jgi:hypothetical protein